MYSSTRRGEGKGEGGPWLRAQVLKLEEHAAFLDRPSHVPQPEEQPTQVGKVH